MTKAHVLLQREAWWCRIGRFTGSRWPSWASGGVGRRCRSLFGPWYWELDRGGPGARARGDRPFPDLWFPQMQNPELAPPGWAARFVDYLYVSFTNACAFSPTDVMPLARWAKLAMLGQSAVSLVTVVLVVARAIGLFE